MLELMAVGETKSVIIIIAQVLFILIAVLISFAILLQEGKGGGLSALAGGSSQQIIGTSNPLRRITVWMAVGFFIIAFFLARYMRPKPHTGKKGGPDTAGAPGQQDKKQDKETPKLEDTKKEKEESKIPADAPGSE